MIRNQEHLQELSETFEINHEDILLIAINACGLSNAKPSRRNRFEFAPFGRENDAHLLIPSFDRHSSPFWIDDDHLYLRETPVGSIRNLQSDDIVMGYWRNRYRSLTLNSNARSACVGCVFCYTHLDPASDSRMSEAEELEAYFGFLEEDIGRSNLGAIEKVTVCSGCFLHEQVAVAHMELVSETARRHGFSGELHLLSSVVRSRKGLEQLARNLSPFHLTLTIECFSNRPEILKRTKAELDFPGMLQLMEEAKQAGVRTDFTFLVGLDSLEEAVPKIEKLIEHTTTFPRFQVYQPHNSFQAGYSAAGSEKIEFYLEMRKHLEELFAPTPLRPQSWENYRPLWYYTFGGKPYNCQRI